MSNQDNKYLQVLSFDTRCNHKN